MKFEKQKKTKCGNAVQLYRCRVSKKNWIRKHEKESMGRKKASKLYSSTLTENHIFFQELTHFLIYVNKKLKKRARKADSLKYTNKNDSRNSRSHSHAYTIKNTHHSSFFIYGCNATASENLCFQTN